MRTDNTSDGPNLEVAGPPSGPQGTPKRPTILIVDHDEDVLLRLEHLLETAGFETTISWRLEQAQDYIEKNKFDLVVVCHYPPVLDAAGVLRRAASTRRSPCIVLHAPERFPFDAEYFYSLGAHSVLSKWAPEIEERVRQLFPPAEASA